MTTDRKIQKIVESIIFFLKYSSVVIFLRPTET